MPTDMWKPARTVELSVSFRNTGSIHGGSLSGILSSIDRSGIHLRTTYHSHFGRTRRQCRYRNPLRL